MSNRGLEISCNAVTSLDELYEMQRSLKTYAKGVITNYNIMPADMKKYIAAENVFYEYQEGKWLTVLLRNNDFYRVYFHIVDMENYRIEFCKVGLVCELFSLDGVEGKFYENEIKMLISLGFCRHSAYHLWTCKPPFASVDSDIYPEVGVSYEPDREMAEKVCQFFDKYSEYTPDLTGNGYENFCKENKFIKLYNRESGEWIGIYIYPMKNKVIDWGFTLINPKYRRRGYGEYMKKLMLREAEKYNIRKCMVWIEDDNIGSKRLHENCGYTLDRNKKVVFVRKGMN